MHATACFNVLFHIAEVQSGFEVISWRKRRASLTRERYERGFITVAMVSDVSRVGRSKRAALVERRTKIDMSTRERIRELSDAGWPLRDVAAETGISHESVRQVLGAATVGVEA